MQVCFLLLLFIQLHVTDGCTLAGRKEVNPVTSYTGGSVTLPCSCTNLQSKPETVTWMKYINQWVEIFPEREQYKDRFQLVKDLSPGNLSLLISHLTEEDDGDYRCRVKGGEYRDLRLTIIGCTLNEQYKEVTGTVGQSVLLPCSCSELQAKPQTFTWIFISGSNPIQIFPKDQTNRYTGRVQFINDRSPGNLSLLISHLTIEDGGDYRCRVKGGEYRDLRLTIIGCTLNEQYKEVTGTVGQSVLLPCSCSALQDKPQTFTWIFLSGSNPIQIFPKDQTNHYTGRVQFINDLSPGNLSLLISHLSLQDEGWYRCTTSNHHFKDIHLTVKVAPPTPSSTSKPGGPNATPVVHNQTPAAPTGTETPGISNSQNIIIIVCAAAAVMLLLGGVMYRRYRGQTRQVTDDGQTGQRTQQKKQDDVMYSTVVHSKTVRAAHTPVTSRDTAVYASIKTN